MHSNEEMNTEHMQIIIDTCTRLHEAAGSKTQEEKIMFHSWIWNLVNGIRVIKDVQVQIKVHDKEILQISVKQSSRT